MAGASWRDAQHLARVLCTQVCWAALQDRWRCDYGRGAAGCDSDTALKHIQINPPCTAELKLSVECLDCLAAKANTFALQVIEGC